MLVCIFLWLMIILLNKKILTIYLNKCLKPIYLRNFFLFYSSFEKDFTLSSKLAWYGCFEFENQDEQARNNDVWESIG